MTEKARPVKALPTIERILSLFDFDVDAGILTWKTSSDKVHPYAGKSAGSIKSTDGYLSIMIDRKRYPAHRLIWKLANGRDPDGVVDHINGNRTDNRPINLRDVTLSQNNHNSSPHSRNTSGERGVYFYKRTGRWKAQICKSGKSHHLGYFDTREEAVAAATQAIANLHGQFAYQARA